MSTVSTKWQITSMSSYTAMSISNYLYPTCALLQRTELAHTRTVDVARYVYRVHTPVHVLRSTFLY